MADFGQNVLASSVALLLIMAVMGLVYFLWSIRLQPSTQQPYDPRGRLRAWEYPRAQR